MAKAKYLKNDYNIKAMLASDIIAKYGLETTQGNIMSLHSRSANVLRELLVFGEHIHIIESIKERNYKNKC